METIQVVIDKKLLQATDKAAKRAKQNRSSLVRDAIREHLRRLETSAKDRQDREGYLRMPQTEEDFVWDSGAEWPDD